MRSLDKTQSCTLTNLAGKGGRIRTIGAPAWVVSALTGWLNCLALDDGAFVLRSIKQDGTINGSLSPAAVRDIVQHYGEKIGIANLNPHDLRRTHAMLSRKGGAPLEVIQQTLGHSSIATTERYLKSGETANAGDYIDLEAQ